MLSLPPSQSQPPWMTITTLHSLRLPPRLLKSATELSPRLSSPSPRRNSPRSSGRPPIAVTGRRQTAGRLLALKTHQVTHGSSATVRFPRCTKSTRPKVFATDACASAAPGDNVFSQGDADVINCLTNLHYQQSGDMCISVAGSSCDNGYVSGGGRVQNLWISSNNLDAAQSSAIQGAYGQLVGQKIRNDNPGGTQIPYVPEVSVLSPTNGAQEILAAVRYIGEDAC